MSATAFISLPRLRAVVGFRQLAAEASQPHAYVSLALVEAHAELIYRAARSEALWVRAAASSHYRKLAVADVSFVPAVLFAEEAVALVDGTWFHFEQGLDDDAFPVDVASLGVAPAYSDPLTPDERVMIDVLKGAFQELATAADTISLMAGLTQRETLESFDAALLSPELGPRDTAIVAESIVRHIAPGIRDTIDAVETIARSLDRIIRETVELYEDVLMDRGGAVTRDDALAGDMMRFDIGPRFADAVSISEWMKFTITAQINGKSRPSIMAIGEYTLGD